MFYGAIILKIVGTFVRWVFHGFKLSFTDVWRGPYSDSSEGESTYEISTNIIGAVTLGILSYIIVKFL
jgi:hypothetical protein